MNAPHNYRQEWRDAWPFAVLILVGIAMFAVKVHNELNMTTAYVRQADALERIANGIEASFYQRQVHLHDELTVNPKWSDAQMRDDGVTKTCNEAWKQLPGMACDRVLSNGEYWRRYKL